MWVWTGLGIGTIFPATMGKKKQVRKPSQEAQENLSCFPNPVVKIRDRLLQVLAQETSVSPLMLPDVLDDLLGLISSQLEDVIPDPDVEVALSPGHLRDQMLEWGYRREDLSEEDVDRILSRLVREMSQGFLGIAP